MKSCRTTRDIEERDRFIDKIFFGLRTIPGTLCRISSRYQQNWGTVIDGWNAGYIENKAVESIYEDWRKGGSDIHRAIENAIDRASLDAGNKELNEILAGRTVPVIQAMLDTIPASSCLNILDIGAGDGDTTIAMLDVLRAHDLEKLADRCHFCLLEPSHKKMAKLGDRLDNHPVKVKRTLISTTFENYAPQMPESYFNIVTANAAFHHMTTPSYLGLLNRKLADGGVLAVGDWYLTLWSQPAFLVPVLQKLKADEDKIQRFKAYFGIKEGDWITMSQKLPKEEQKSNEHMVDYICFLQDELRHISARSRVKLFEAHQSLKETLSDVHDSGFTTNLEELKEKHRGFVKVRETVTNVYTECNIASVYLAGKLPRQLAHRQQALAKVEPQPKTKSPFAA